MTKSPCLLSTITRLAMIVAIVAVGFGQLSQAVAKTPVAKKAEAKKKPLAIKPIIIGEEEQCGEFGTTVVFADSPLAAAKQALKEEKLVFVLHVSGNFETPDFT